jgi:hypothetical protein
MATRSRRKRDPTVLYAFVTVLSIVATIGALVLHWENRARLAAYRADPRCGTKLTAVDTSAGQAPGCVVLNTIVANRWIRRARNTREYRLAVNNPNGGTDSLELSAARGSTTWNKAAPGTAVMAERFTEPGPGARPRVTAVRLDATPVRTAWNPEYRAEGNLLAIIVFLPLTTIFAALTIRANRRRKNEAERVVFRESYRVTIKIP